MDIWLMFLRIPILKTADQLTHLLAAGTTIADPTVIDHHGRTSGILRIGRPREFFFLESGRHLG